MPAEGHYMDITWLADAKDACVGSFVRRAIGNGEVGIIIALLSGAALVEWHAASYAAFSRGSLGPVTGQSWISLGKLDLYRGDYLGTEYAVSKDDAS